jgi:hypothetical protein
MYHVNPLTGEVGECHATKQSCRYGQKNHWKFRKLAEIHGEHVAERINREHERATDLNTVQGNVGSGLIDDNTIWKTKGLDYADEITKAKLINYLSRNKLYENDPALIVGNNYYTVPWIDVTPSLRIVPEGYADDRDVINVNTDMKLDVDHDDRRVFILDERHDANPISIEQGAGMTLTMDSRGTLTNAMGDGDSKHPVIMTAPDPDMITDGNLRNAVITMNRIHDNPRRLGLLVDQLVAGKNPTIPDDLQESMEGIIKRANFYNPCNYREGLRLCRQKPIMDLVGKGIILDNPETKEAIYHQSIDDRIAAIEV